MRISIDFDGTIVDHEFPEIGKVKVGAIEAITKLRMAGHDIIISSCRNNMALNKGNMHYLNELMKFTVDNGLSFCDVDLGNQGKVVADVYIDDRAIEFKDNWEEIEKRVLGKF